MRDFIRLGGILFAITAVVALVLAIANKATYQRIEDLQVQSKLEAQQEVLQGIDVIKETAEEIKVEKESTVKSVTKFSTEEGSSVFAVTCAPKGYGGEISMMVGVDEELKVTGVSIIDNSKETPGLGSKIGEPSFYSQFIGKTKDIGVSKKLPKDNEIQAVTGATISSRAVTKGVNDAINAVGEVLGK